MKIETQVMINSDGKVGEVRWNSDGQECVAKLNGATNKYAYTSSLHGDAGKTIGASGLSSLVNCLLNAHIHLGAIPPQKFEAVPCEIDHGFNRRPPEE